MRTRIPKFKQVAAVPIRGAGPELQVMLVTSRETRRWVVPKGWPWDDRGAHESAAAEAWEEAGVTGAVQPEPVGRFHYDKRRKGNIMAVQVTVFLLEVLEEAPQWPEQAQRQRAWFSPEAAAEAVLEDELKQILRSLGT